MKNFFYSIKELPYIVKQFPRNIKHFFYWLPIIWLDRDWDEHFFFIILRHKLKSMQKYFEKNAHFVGMEKEARRMKICVMLLNRLIAEQYMEIAFKEHEKKWGNFTYDLNDIKRTKVTPETEEQERIEAKRCYELEDHLRQQDIDWLCKIISRYGFGWWD